MDRAADLERFLHTLAGQIDDPDELIIVDAGTKAGVEALLTPLKDTGRLVVKHLRTSPNLIAQRKAGLANTTCEIICYFDDDVLLESDCIAQIRAGFCANPNIGGLTGLQLNADGPRFPTLRSLLEWPLRYAFFVAYDHGNGRFRLSGEGARTFTDTQAHPVQVLSGCFMCYRRSALEQIDFDEDHPFWCEDVMISYQVAQRYTNLYWPAARLTHNHSTVCRNLDTRDKFRELVYSKYYQRHTILKRGVVRDTAFRLSLVGHALLCLSHRDLRGTAGILAGRRKARERGML
jgi:GT2 family glycosyltransferase